MSPVPLNDMKYSRLTKEQFEELNQEFSTFLATQTIDKAEWDKIKKESPEVAEQELDKKNPDLHRDSII